MSKLSRLLQPMSNTGLSRRGFMIGATGTGFTLAFMPLIAQSCATQSEIHSNFEPTVWYAIDPSGVITVNVAEAEMGQHIGTALARIIADELEADWLNVKLRYVDTEAKFGYRVTGGSWSIWHNFDLLSRAGAAGKQALIEEGAKLLGVSKFACDAHKSQVICKDQSISYAEIVRRGDISRSFSEDELLSMPIKHPDNRSLIGVDTQALDIPEKTTGQAIYGIDASYPNMLYGKPILPPTRYGASITKIDDTAALGVAGYQQTLILQDPSNTVPGWAVVVADSYHGALRAASLVKITWNAGGSATVSEADILDHGVKLINSKAGALLIEDDNVDMVFKTAADVLSERYTTSTVLHFPMEPVNALALEKNGIWEIHTGNQWQSLTLPVYAKALGVAEDKILMRTYLIGGGFGRRLLGDYGVPALLAAKALGKPIKLVLSREDDSRFDSVRSASVQELSMAFDKQTKVVGMQHHAAAGWPSEVMAPGFLGTGKNGEKYDPFSISGANHWYSVGAHRVRAISNDLANSTFRPGWLRSVGPGWTNWALESFMDEAAHRSGVDPVEFRLQHLISQGINKGEKPNSVGGADRLAHVLRRAAQKSSWESGLEADTGRGVAITFGQERDMPTWCACVAVVRVDRQTGHITLKKLTLVVDAGIIVHPDGAMAQTEGAALWGVSMALHEGTRFKNGEVEDTNLDTYTPLRMSDVPDLDIEFVKNNYQSVGLGEPGTTVVAPAIGNAIYSAVGVRLRHLPMTSADIKAELS
ncbi:MAG: molybdopterin-dependent oxidoreductase [Pseudomonadales bacterium]|nr:molybdopterin-dependent oxidoreductase [Pseudomonadales bacterium]